MATKFLAHKGSHVIPDKKVLPVIRFYGVTKDKTYEVVNLISGNDPEDHWYEIKADDGKIRRFHYLFFDLCIIGFSQDFAIDKTENIPEIDIVITKCKMCGGTGKIQLLISEVDCDCNRK